MTIWACLSRPHHFVLVNWDASALAPRSLVFHSFLSLLFVCFFGIFCFVFLFRNGWEQVIVYWLSLSLIAMKLSMQARFGSRYSNKNTSNIWFDKFAGIRVQISQILVTSWKANILFCSSDVWREKGFSGNSAITFISEKTNVANARVAHVNRWLSSP